MLEKLVLIVLLKPKAFCFVQENPKYITDNFGYDQAIFQKLATPEYQIHSRDMIPGSMGDNLTSSVQFRMYIKWVKIFSMLS